MSLDFGRANISNEKLRRGNIISVSDHWRRKTREIEPSRIDRQEMTFMIFSSPYFWRTTHTGRHKGAVFDKMTELCALKPASLSKDDDGDVDGDA